MKFLLLGDTHISDKKPERRKEASNEEYFQTFINKLSQVKDIYYDRECDVLIQVGDFFDSYNVTKEVIAEMIQALRKAKMNIFCIYGQHDISGHSDTTFRNSPLRVLESAGVVQLLSSGCLTGVDQKERIVLYGCPFGKTIEEPVSRDDYNVLVTHQMVGDEPLFPGHDIKQPITFLKEHPNYNLIVCGDYHYRFIKEYNNRYCINPGALIRKTINQRDLALEPGVILFDTAENYHEVIKLNVVPAEEIFDFTEEVSTKAKDTSVLDSFLNNLSSKEGTKIGWKSLLSTVMDEKKTSKGVRKVIEDSILEVTKV